MSSRRSASAPELLDEFADEFMPAHLCSDLRQRLLVAGWPVSLPPARRAYASDLLAWQRWSAARDLDPLRARRVLPAEVARAHAAWSPRMATALDVAPGAGREALHEARKAAKRLRYARRPRAGRSGSRASGGDGA